MRFMSCALGVFLLGREFSSHRATGMSRVQNALNFEKSLIGHSHMEHSVMKKWKCSSIMYAHFVCKPSLATTWGGSG